MTARAEPGESLTAKLLGAQQGGSEEIVSGMTDPLIQGLVGRLPQPNAVWSSDEAMGRTEELFRMLDERGVLPGALHMDHEQIGGDGAPAPGKAEDGEDSKRAHERKQPWLA
jgi:hypothetical protein